MSKHTPGPLHVCAAAFNDASICDKHGNVLGGAYAADDGSRPSGEIDANAQLWAAAPALVEALTGFLDYFDPHGGVSDVPLGPFERARTALALLDTEPTVEEEPTLLGLSPDIVPLDDDPP